jgi:hypothetical protein
MKISGDSIVEEQFNYIYLRIMCFTVAPARHKICVLYVEKSTSYLGLKCANTFREFHKCSRIRCVNIIFLSSQYPYG